MKFLGLLASAAVLVATGLVRVHDRNTTPVPTAMIEGLLLAPLQTPQLRAL